MSTRASAFCGEAAGLGGWGSPTGTMASELVSALGDPKSSPLKRSIFGAGIGGVVDRALEAGERNWVPVPALEVDLQRKYAHID